VTQVDTCKHERRSDLRSDAALVSEGEGGVDRLDVYRASDGVVVYLGEGGGDRDGLDVFE
jgi:hypothetical protein